MAGYAIGELEFPSMPIADQLSIGDAAGRERRSTVGTCIAERRENAARVDHADQLRVGLEFAQLALGWQFCNTGNAHKTRHFHNITRPLRSELALFEGRDPSPHRQFRKCRAHRATPDVYPPFL